MRFSALSREDRFIERHMPRRSSFSHVETIGKTLPDVEVTTSWGGTGPQACAGRCSSASRRTNPREPDTLV